MSLTRDSFTRRTLADMLVDLGAVSPGPNGRICCNTQKIQYDHDIRTYVSVGLGLSFQEKRNINLVASVANGAVSHGALAAQMMRLPHAVLYKDNTIEGNFKMGQRVLLIEDYIVTGQSALRALDAARAQELDVVGITAIVDLGTPETEALFEKKKCQVVTLTDYAALMNAIEKRGGQTSDQIRLLPK